MLDQTPREGAHTLEPLLAHVSRLARLLVQEGHPGRGRDLTGSLKNTVLNMWAPVFESRPTRFIVLARYRSGSTLLSDALNSHAGVLCLDELYNISPLAGDLAKLEDPIAIARTAFEPPRDRGVKAVGFKLMYEQVLAPFAVDRSAAPPQSRGKRGVSPAGTLEQ